MRRGPGLYPSGEGRLVGRASPGILAANPDISRNQVHRGVESEKVVWIRPSTCPHRPSFGGYRATLRPSGRAPIVTDGANLAAAKLATYDSKDQRPVRRGPRSPIRCGWPRSCDALRL